MQRAERLLAEQRALAPVSAVVLNTYVSWLRSVGRCAEVMRLPSGPFRTDPNRMRTMDRDLQRARNECKVFTGHAEEDLALQTKRTN